MWLKSSTTPSYLASVLGVLFKAGLQIHQSEWWKAIDAIRHALGDPRPDAILFRGIDKCNAHENTNVVLVAVNALAVEINDEVRRYTVV